MTKNSTSNNPGAFNLPPKLELGKKVVDFVNNSKELLAILLNIFTGVILFKTDDDVSHSYFTKVVEVLNLATLLVAIIMLSRRYPLIVSEHKRKQLAEFEKLPSEQIHTLKTDEQELQLKLHGVNSRIERINKLVVQFIAAHKGFAISLVFLYVLLFIDTNNSQRVHPSPQTKIALTDVNENLSKSNDSFFNRIDSAAYHTPANKDVLSKLSQKDSNSIVNGLRQYNKILIAKVKDSITRNTDRFLKEVEFSSQGLAKATTAKDSIEVIFRTRNSLTAIISEPQASNKYIIDRLVYIMVDNFFNIISATFLFMAFGVLYYQTLENDDKTWKVNFILIPSTAAIGLIMFVFLSTTLGLGKANLNTITILSRILSGTFNGVAMALLFSRFIAMEYFFKRSSRLTELFYNIGTTIILPLYAVVQPLYGLFDTQVLGDSEFLKNLVLLLCLWGKVFLFLFVYQVLNNKWFHIYIYTLGFSEQRIKEVKDKFDAEK